MDIALDEVERLRVVRDERRGVIAAWEVVGTQGDFGEEKQSWFSLCCRSLAPGTYPRSGSDCDDVDCLET